MTNPIQMMNTKVFYCSVIALLVNVATAHANLLVKVGEPKTTGGKAVIELEIKNTFKEKIESARAVVFLFDDQGKVVGQTTRWVIGGTKDKPALAPDSKTTYNFVVPTDKPFTKTKVSFNRVILEGGKVFDVNSAVNIEDAKK